MKGIQADGFTIPVKIQDDEFFRSLTAGDRWVDNFQEETKHKEEK
jgi:hypothetical protein